MPALPALLVVVDEFSELLTQRPELVDLLVTIGRLGRSLGIHLLLASQRLDEGRLRGLDSHLSYRIALRTFSAAESRAVLGVPDAHQLPPAPGSAFLATGTGELVRFRAAYVSGPTAAGPAGPEARHRAPPRRAHRFRVGPVGSSADASAPALGAGTGGALGARHDDRRDGRARTRRASRVVAPAGCVAAPRRAARPARRPVRTGSRGAPAPGGPCASPSAWSTGRTCNAATR